MLGVGAANFVDAQIESLFRHLCGDNGGASRVDPVKNCLLKGETILVFVLRDAADAKGLDNNGVVARLQRFEDAWVYTRSELEGEDSLVKGIEKTGLGW